MSPVRFSTVSNCQAARSYSGRPTIRAHLRIEPQKERSGSIRVNALSGFEGQHRSVTSASPRMRESQEHGKECMHHAS